MPNPPLPLSKYMVLDLTLARAGPTAVRLLADWGANVIRVEPPAQHKNTEEGNRKPASGFTGNRQSADSQNLQRNKRGICLDLKGQVGRAVFMDLVRQADVVVENFRVEVKHRLAVDYESLRKINPAIIYGSISGFGQDGPYSNRPGVDQIVQGSSGLMSITGEPGRGPMRAGIAISDTSAGMFLGQGILLALLHREQTGEGQWVHTSLLESMLNKLDFQGARYTMNGEVPEQSGNHHPTNTPMGTFESSDGLINLAASTDKMFNAFCAAMNAKDLMDEPRYQSFSGRNKYRKQLNQKVNLLTKQFSSEFLISKLNEAGIPCGPINTIEGAFEDEQVKHLAMTKVASHSQLGDLNLVRSPINLSRFPHSPRFDRAGPELGEHTEEVLRQLGYSEEKIQQLQNSGVV